MKLSAINKLRLEDFIALNLTEFAQQVIALQESESTKLTRQEIYKMAMEFDGIETPFLKSTR